MNLRAVALMSLFLLPQLAWAELQMSSIFGDSMVVQRNQPVHVWGWADPSAEVTVQLAGKSATTQADSQSGRFDVELDPLPAGGPHQLSVQANGQERTFEDVLVGEVWICSGQSNMAWPVQSANDPDLETLSANFPNIRLISVPQVGSQEPKQDFQGEWTECTPETVKDFSAVGYFFGRRLHQTLDVPVGLVDNAWGGSAAEAWVARDVLESAGKYEELLQYWDKLAESFDYEAEMTQWQKQRREWIEGGRQGTPPRQPRNRLAGQHRPANLYNGVLYPTIGYTIAGVIWYQGESNASRAAQYRDLFPLMIQSWRDAWGQGDFPFYWVQLADFRAEQSEPGDSDWAELREAQTMTMARLDNTGQAVIVNLGEASDIHPKNKQDVAKRLTRWALARDYGYAIAHRSPQFQSMTIEGNKAILTFDHVGEGLDTFDVREMRGFTIAGADQEFVEAQARFVPGKTDTIQVWSPQVPEPVAVRYAWADNPVANVQSKVGLPLTPFRTDQWKGITEGKVSP